MGIHQNVSLREALFSGYRKVVKVKDGLDTTGMKILTVARVLEIDLVLNALKYTART